MAPDLLHAAQRAVALLQQGQPGVALAELEGVMAQHPAQAKVLNLAATLALRAGMPEKSETYAHGAVQLAEAIPDYRNTLALAMKEQGRLDEAEAQLRQALTLDPDQADTWLNLGNVCRLRKDVAQARSAYEAALQRDPAHVDAHYNLGLLLSEQDAQAAEAAFRQALVLNPRQADVLNDLGNLLTDGKRESEAEACYHQALSIDPNCVGAVCNLGILLLAQRRFLEALSAFKQALAIQPDYANAYIGMGNVLVQLGLHQEAEAAYVKALSLSPESASLHNNLGNLLLQQGFIAKAHDQYRQAVALCPDYGHALGQAIFCARKNYDWRSAEADDADVLSALKRGVKGLPSLWFMSLDGATRGDHRTAGHLACHEAVATLLARPAMVASLAERSDVPLNIGYLSADFRDHAVMHLLGGVLAAHDRTAFVIHAYAIGGPSNDTYRNRVMQTCAAFHDLDALSDQQAAEQIASDGIHILVDLSGHTTGSRSGILARRPAPVIVNWLGYPCSLGYPGLADYIIGDPVVTPLEDGPDYTETIVQMPHCYLPADDQRPIGPCPGRAEAGLPEHAFVFGSFSQSYKLTPRMFDTWCRLLRDVPDSVLWLAGNNTLAQENLRREAADRGVDPARLIFAGRTEGNAEHLGRLRLADLMLDTFPYTSHTTGSDALWAGVPLVTLKGDTFVSRVAASLLYSVGLPELVAESMEGYYSLARDLALDPSRLASLRQRLADNRLTRPLFDTQGFTRNLEKLYQALWQQHRQGLRQPIEAADL